MEKIYLKAAADGGKLFAYRSIDTLNGNILHILQAEGGTRSSANIGGTNKELAPSCTGAVPRDGKRFADSASEAELKAWAAQF